MKKKSYLQTKFSGSLAVEFILGKSAILAVEGWNLFGIWDLITGN
jgi:hypothetical protein